MAAAEDQDIQALVVTVGGEQLAIPAADVIEVVRKPRLTRVPLSPPGLLGIASLRGSVIAVVSLGTLIGRATGGDDGRRIVIVNAGVPTGIAVDEVLSLRPLAELASGERPARLADIGAMLASQFATMAKPKSSLAFQRTAEDAAQGAAPEATETFFSFDIAGQSFGLRIQDVREVLAVPPSISLVPHTDDAMLGVVSLRNALLPVVHLGALLGLRGGGGGSGARIVVALIGGVPVGLMVDGVNPIVRATSGQLDAVPRVLTRGAQEARIQSICRLEGGTKLLSILSTDHLLKDGLAERLKAEGDRVEDKETDVSSAVGLERFLVFRLGEEQFGLPIDSVLEVVAAPDRLTSLPKAPAFVEGVMNLRGQVVPIIDQRQRFESTTSERGRKARIIVVRVGNGMAGFMVDDVSEVLGVHADKLRRSPELAQQESNVIDRVANLEHEGRMILVIDPQALLDRAEQDMVAAMQKDGQANS
ncbi:MAG TPA: chemotaxis protein CheW [Sphingomicrobium sp.]